MNKRKRESIEESPVKKRKMNSFNLNKYTPVHVREPVHCPFHSHAYKSCLFCEKLNSKVIKMGYLAEPTINEVKKRLFTEPEEETDKNVTL